MDYRVAATDEEFDAIFRLRYEAYRREGFIRPDFTEKFSDDYDAAENGRIFGVYVDSRLVSSIRIHIASESHADCPSFKTFSDVIEPELRAGKVLVDPTRFVTDRSASRQLNGLPYITLRLCWMAALHFEADHFLVAIRPEHQAFYRRTFRHRLVCPARAYALLNCPISLMSVNCAEVADRVYARYPFFRSNAFERRMLFEAPTGEPMRRAGPAVAPSHFQSLQETSSA
ncbi:MAG: N-acyl amino acid synthase FeeM domain-containing protein [Boseongicola sp.]